MSAASWYHLLIFSLAAFLGKSDVCCQVIDNLPGLLVVQYGPDGAPQAAIAGHDEQRANILAWLQLVALSECLGRDLMNHRMSTGQSLEGVLAWAGHETHPVLPVSAVKRESDLFFVLGAGQELGLAGSMPASIRSLLQ